MSEPSQPTAPSEESPPSPVPSAALHVLPAQIFFTDLIDAPEGVEGDEIDALVELEIEQSSPFPIEQLIWGWILINDRKTILTFATTLEKARASGVKEFDSAQLPILAPFTACLFKPAEASGLIIHGLNSDAVAISYQDGQASEVEALSLDAEMSEEALEHQAASLFSDPESIKFQHCYLGDAKHDDDAGLSWPIFRNPSIEPDSAPIHTIELESSSAWYVDLRDRDYKFQRQKELSQSKRVWKALSILAVVAIVMILLEIVQWSARQFLEFQEISIAQQGPIVERLEEQTAFLHKMSAIEQSQMRPFALMAILNENRPDKIHFLRAEAINATEYEFQLQGSSVSEVNNYISSYQGNAAFESLEHKITNSRSGRVLFDLMVKVKQLPEVAALSPGNSDTSDQTESEQEGS
ncbi:MAG: hypothetical protein AAF212_00440 [Verrucomicrobiota bacterium]